MSVLYLDGDKFQVLQFLTDELEHSSPIYLAVGPIFTLLNAAQVGCTMLPAQVSRQVLNDKHYRCTGIFCICLERLERVKVDANDCISYLWAHLVPKPKVDICIARVVYRSVGCSTS